MIEEINDLFKKVGIPVWTDILDIRYSLCYLISKERATNILDVGCGSGVFLKISDANLKVGIDINLKTLKKVKKQWPELQLIQAAAQSLPIKDNSHDFVICIGMLNTIKKMQLEKEAISEIKRCSNNKIIIMNLNRSSVYYQEKEGIIENYEVLKLLEAYNNKTFSFNSLPRLILFALRKLIRIKFFEKTIYSFLYSKNLEKSRFYYIISYKN